MISLMLGAAWNLNLVLYKTDMFVQKRQTTYQSQTTCEFMKKEFIQQHQHEYMKIVANCDPKP